LRYFGFSARSFGNPLMEPARSLATSKQETVPRDGISVDSGDLAAMGAALEPHTRRLKTLGLYEQRRRRAAKETLVYFNEVELQHHTAQQEQLQSCRRPPGFQKISQTWDPRNLASFILFQKSSSSSPGKTTNSSSQCFARAASSSTK
jgi:hypothetical protein